MIWVISNAEKNGTVIHYKYLYYHHRARPIIMSSYSVGLSWGTNRMLLPREDLPLGRCNNNVSITQCAAPQSERRKVKWHDLNLCQPQDTHGFCLSRARWLGVCTLRYGSCIYITQVGAATAKLPPSTRYKIRVHKNNKQTRCWLADFALPLGWWLLSPGSLPSSHVIHRWVRW